MQLKTPKKLSTILLVEDDQDVETLVKLSLEEMAGIKVQSISKERDAVYTNVDLMLLDIIEPEKSIQKMIETLRAKYHLLNTPILMLTAKHSLKMNETLKSEGVIGVIYKPFDPIHLSTEIKKYWAEIQSKNQTFDLKFSELTQKYTSSLPDKYAFIKNHWEALSEKGWKQETFDELYKMVHHLLGTGATFKHPEISEQAEKILQMLKTMARKKDLIPQEKEKVSREIAKLNKRDKHVI